MTGTSGADGRCAVWLNLSDAACTVGFGRNSLDRAMTLGAVPFRIRNGQRLIEQGAALLLREKLLKLASEVQQ